MVKLIVTYGGYEVEEELYRFPGSNTDYVMLFADAWLKGYRRGYEEMNMDATGAMGYATPPDQLIFTMILADDSEKELIL